VISEPYRQQSIILYINMPSITDRIVNLVQRQVRPIVRGKARAAVEFGAVAQRASACGRSAFL
jgi:IS5 family transposase